MDVFPWLTLTNREDGALLRECPAAFDTLALSKSKSTECFPKFVTILGTRSKAKLLKRLLGEADSRYSLEQHGQVHLWSDPGSRDTEEPFIYIDCELQNVETPHWRPPTPAVGPDIVRNVVIGSESDRTAGALGARIHANVLAPLSSVVCFVAADLGGVLGVATTLANHVAVSFQCEEDITLPYALVIFDGTSDCELDCAWLRLDIIERVAAILQDSGPTSSEFDPQNPLKSHFSDLRVVELMNEPAKCLYDAVSALSWEVQFKRRSAGLLYNFHHCQAFCELLLHRMCSDDRSPFSFIRSSRAHGFNADELGRHLEELFDLLTTGPQSQFWEVALPLISSALVMASYPPGAHMFPPFPTFRTLYLVQCKTAVQKYSAHVDVPKFIRRLEDKFCFNSSEPWNTKSRANLPRRPPSSEGSQHAAALHRRCLQSLHKSMSQLFSNTTCLACLMHTPEKPFECGHALCDQCIRTSGARSRTEKHVYELENCILCGQQNSSKTFRFVPPTAGLRLLSIDGGGVRGVIPLQILESLDDELKKHFGCSIHEAFDFVVGTSAGGLITLGVFLMYWDVRDFKRRSDSIAARTFRRALTGSRFLDRISKVISSLAKDCQYDTAAIKSAFQTTTGSEVKMFNPLCTDTKVAVTTTTARESFACLFSNYNGSFMPEDSSYQLLRGRQPRDEPTIGEAAACTSAAPPLFRPEYLENFGTFMDGALTHNNPINIAAWESRRLWPEKGHPDFTVSLGTGRPKGIKTYLLGPHSPVKEKFYSRLVTTFMNHLDPEKIWLDFITSVPKEFKSRYIRINVPLDGKYFRLDNLEAFRDLESQAKAFITTNPELERIVPAICASSFYFELDSMPRFIDDEYHCCGHIYCRLNLSDSSNGGRKRLLDTLRKSSARFLVNGQSIPCLISEQEPPPRKRTSKEKKCVSRADSLIDDGRSLLRDDEDCSDFEEQRAELQREDEVVDANAREEEEERRIPLYKRPISFRVPDLDKEIGISVMGQDRSEFFDENGIFHPKYATRMPRHGLHISGFPTSVRKIIAHQGLASRFGHADYRDLGKPLPPLPLKRKHDYYLGRDALLLSRATDF